MFARNQARPSSNALFYLPRHFHVRAVLRTDLFLWSSFLAHYVKKISFFILLFQNVHGTITGNVITTINISHIYHIYLIKKQMFGLIKTIRNVSVSIYVLLVSKTRIIKYCSRLLGHTRAICCKMCSFALKIINH